MKKAVIFDLDGTLSDSIMSMKYSGDKTMAEFGYGPFSVQDYKYFVGDGAANLVKRALIKGGDTELTHFEAKRGMKIAVLSNKPHHATLDVIESLFGKDYFDVVQGQVDGVPIKPDPAGVFRILDRFGLTADEVLYMGDTATDMKTGKAAGAFTVGVLWGFRDRKELEEGHADAIIAQPLDLLKYCE